MCIHETLQLSDEDWTIYCPDCGREFARLGRDEDQTLMVVVRRDNPVVVVAPKEDHGFGFTQRGFGMTMQEVYPCAKCGFDFKCEEPDGCHT